MSVDKEDKFDEMLGRALRGSPEPPFLPPAGGKGADFTDRMLRQIREAEEQRILARVVLQERLALAGCIVLGIIAIVVAVVFPGIATSFTKQIGGFSAGCLTALDKIPQAIEAVSNEWQLYMTVFVGVFGFAVYSLLDLLVGDS